MRRSIHLIGEHYPERSVSALAGRHAKGQRHVTTFPPPFSPIQLVIMIVGAPSWFSVLWKMIRPLVNSRTQAKIKICSKKGTFCFIGRKGRKRRREGIVTSVPQYVLRKCHHPFFTRLGLFFSTPPLSSDHHRDVRDHQGVRGARVHPRRVRRPAQVLGPARQLPSPVAGGGAHAGVCAGREQAARGGDGQGLERAGGPVV